ncbi:hypothetical protein MAPG_10234 [Magnaporthiopsis poae ATCC 64411]|uniref:N-acetyltransferase domain-containing protein n=1 Tax=Magnaporthiopsis poae (strain ATCC 64411 / 73-15) TaxID=644358 RepID=A0A0C4EC21_MAGP6|nr:hypothetical protein MAPG_10234 [Magnaporthiopsis poae ATCC 64411]
MPFEFGFCRPEDMDRCFEVVSLAFAHDHPYVDALFPGHDTPQGREHGARWLAEADLSPTTRLCKVVDTDTGVIAGFAKWDVYDGFTPDVGPSSLKGDHWPDEDAKEYADYIWWEFTRRRWAAVKKSGGRLVSLDLMTVDPAYHRRGVGKLLMKYGVDEADRLGVKSVVEATKLGRRLYESFGFETREDVLIPNPPKQAGQKEQFMHWMTRPARDKQR